VFTKAMGLSLEINILVGAFVVPLTGAARKRCIGLAWKSDRGLRPWQMYIRVSWEPGRADVSFSKEPVGKSGVTKSWYSGDRFPNPLQAERKTRNKGTR
jgi:hypothetical protein